MIVHLCVLHDKEGLRHLTLQDLGGVGGMKLFVQRNPFVSS